MAVTITTEFYETTWHDLSKVVFTSPNMDTGITAGTRSHILPGELNLATWYEDTILCIVYLMNRLIVMVSNM
jgi:hypothetical protein